MLHPESLIDFKVYEDKNEYLGVAQVGLPDIAYITQTITGAGIAGNVTPASPADANGEYSTYYYAAYKDGKQLWEIDPHNYICVIDGVDYMAPVRKALGK